VTDVWFVVAGYTVILGGLALYAGLLLLRLREARRTLDGMQRTGNGAATRNARSGEPPADRPA
jgi:hypothetical protein